jgi:uncharacterized membrane protein
VLLVGVIVLVEVHAIGYAFTLAGLSPGWAAVVLLASLVGSLVDIPLARLPPETRRVGYQLVPWWGTVYAVPVTRRYGEVTVAVNVGGAVVPTLVSGYLLVRLDLWLPALVAVVGVAIVVHLTARPVRGEGIAVPLLVPALAAAAASLVLSPDHDAGALAYVAGTLGTLVGGDLTRLRQVRTLQASAVSIGGAGTFDGVFLSGVLAVLLGALL